MLDKKDNRPDFGITKLHISLCGRILVVSSKT
jgi:hypothetical protein